MAQRHFTKYVADFETTVYDGQEYTEVWLAGFCELYTEQPQIQYSLGKFLQAVFSLKQNCQIYFHNLKFDGTFILDWIKRDKSFREKLITDGVREHMEKDYHLRHKEYIYQISDKGVFYSLTINYRGYLYKFYDSLKLLPFSLKSVGKAFGTKHQKLEMEYEGERHANESVSQDEMEYFLSDLYVLKEALEIMFDRGLTKSTIGSNALAVFKRGYDKEDYNRLFPQVYDMDIDEAVYGSPSVGEYIHKSYRGGWCYAKEERRDTIYYNGCTVDANSLYPSRMRLEKYPVGEPTFFQHDIPDIAHDDKHVYFVRIKCKFELKENYLPFIQIKGDLRYNGREMLKSSTIYTKSGLLVMDERVTMTMTGTDYELFVEHYNLYDFELLDGCYFSAVYGLFDEYVDYYMQQKIESTNLVDRTISKLLLNNLYGKFAMYLDSSFKVCFLQNDVIHYRTVREMDKEPTYIPIGTYITSYARNTTIRLAQKNYKHFCYADTDSLHCDCSPCDLIDVPIDDKKLGYWKVEIEWERAIFHRAKSYIESYQKDGIERYDIKCAGMGKEPKSMLEHALMFHDGNVSRETILKNKNWSDKQKEWVLRGAEITDFKTGLEIFGNLKAHTIIGGIVLKKCPFKLRC